MKRKGRKGGKKMEEVTITLKEITDFYEMYGINSDKKEEYPQIPSAFEDIPLVFTNSTIQKP